MLDGVSPGRRQPKSYCYLLQCRVARENDQGALYRRLSASDLRIAIIPRLRPAARLPGELHGFSGRAPPDLSIANSILPACGMEWELLASEGLGRVAALGQLTSKLRDHLGQICRIEQLPSRDCLPQFLNRELRLRFRFDAVQSF